MNVEVYWSHSFLSDRLRPGGLVFDVGVNDGGFSRLMAAKGMTVVGFEPDPEWATKLVLPENVRLIAKAVAATAGRRHLYVNQGLCSSMHYSEGSGRSVEIDAVTLESALALAPGQQIDLLKLDVEGEEIEILKHAPASAFDRVAQMAVEFHDFLDPAQTPAILQIIERFRGLGFDVVCFSFRSYGDTLFINHRLTPLSRWQRVWLVVRFKYLRGAARVVRRLVRA